jgi:hemolysin-activating ACP:hemolysin acyltransferase
MNADQRPYQYRGWPSKGYDIAGSYHVNGRNICEPTDRFSVQISYLHNWITPLGSLTGLTGGVVLNRQINGKIEAKYFQSSAAAVGLCI